MFRLKGGRMKQLQRRHYETIKEQLHLSDKRLNLTFQNGSQF